MALPTPASIARLEESHLARSIVALAPTSIALAGGIVARGTPGSWINKAIGLGMEGPVAPEAIDALIDYHASAGIEPRIEVSPYADPSLLPLLADRAFILRRFAQTLAYDLDSHRTPDPIDAAPAGLTFQTIRPDDVRAVGEFARTASLGLTPPGMEPNPGSDDVWIAACRTPGNTCVLARLDGRPASASALIVAAPYARLYGLSTLPEFRRRGLQRAGLLYRLHLAAQQGATFATITSDPAGPTERNAIRLGFMPIFTRAILARPAPGLVPTGGSAPTAPTPQSPR